MKTKNRGLKKIENGLESITETQGLINETSVTASNLQNNFNCKECGKSSECLKVTNRVRKALKRSLARESALRRKIEQMEKTIEDNKTRVRYWKQKFKRISKPTETTPEKNVKKSYETRTQCGEKAANVL